MSTAAAVGAGLALTGALRPGAADGQTVRKGGHLQIGIDGASSGDSLDPATYASSYMIALGWQFGNCLVEIDSHGRAVPELAESWEPKPGAKEWVFKLRRGIAFHNGRELTATDVVYSINHHRGPGTKSGAAGLLKSVSDVKASDKYEVTFGLRSPYADLPYVLADFHLLVLPEGAPFDSGIGTGGYIVDSYKPGIRSLTKRNPNYWKEGRANVDSVETIAINDPMARLSALESGGIQLMNRVDPKLVEVLRRNPKLQVFEISGTGHYTFPMRCDTPPYNNSDLRLALKYAVDREDLVKRIMRGHGKVGNDQPVPSYDRFFAADIPQRPYDPDKAAYHFKKSGYTGSLVLSVSDAAFVGAVDAAQLFQRHAAKAGITIEVDREPSDGYWTNVWMKKPFCASYWNGRPTPDLQFSIAYASDAAWNDAFWKRPDFDKLLLGARAELDETKRRQMYHDLQLMIVDDGGQIIPMFNNFIDGGRANVKGFHPSPAFEFAGLRAAEQVWLEG